MNTENGKIIFVPSKSDKPNVPEGHIALKNPPKPGCPSCKGAGALRRIVKKPGKRGVFKFEYYPCSCTNDDCTEAETELRAATYEDRFKTPPSEEALEQAEQSAQNSIARAIAVNAVLKEKLHAFGPKAVSGRSKLPQDMVSELPEI